MLYRKGAMMDFEGHKLDYLIVNSKEEQKAAKGWFDHPSKAVKKSRIRKWMTTIVRPWWNEWEWSLKLLAAILIIIAAAVKIFPYSSNPEGIPKPQSANSK